MIALIWTLFAESDLAQPDSVVAGTTGVGAALASVRLDGVGSQPLSWCARQVRTLISLLFYRWAWVETATVVAGKNDEGAALASVRLVGVGSASHCGGGQDR